jgi:hypothetical protein
VVKQHSHKKYGCDILFKKKCIIKPMNSKKTLGQFYTTNYKYILQDFTVDKKEKIIEPFAGKGDLLNFVTNNNIEAYDIEPKLDKIIKRDTLLDPPDYKNKFVLTNPPYLARNKCKDKQIYIKYDCDDLYKCFIISIINNNPNGGIIIVPLNFWCSETKKDIILRKKFLKKFQIIQVNVFEEQVFEDTNYTVCSFKFILNNNPSNEVIKFKFLPTKEILSISIKDGIIGEQFKPSKKFKIERITSKNCKEFKSNLVLKCIDDTNQICLFIDNENPEKYIDTTTNNSNRAYALLKIIPETNNEELVKSFNEKIKRMRNETHSLFLTNYRENFRKRISFTKAYQIICHILEKLD